MFEAEVARRFEKARAEGKAYLLVCFDWFDRLRGDEDFGYYYPSFDSVDAVLLHLKTCQLGPWDVRDPRDGCEAVIDLGRAGEADGFSRACFESPLQWLARIAP